MSDAEPIFDAVRGLFLGAVDDTATGITTLAERIQNPDEKLRDTAGALKILADVTSTFGALLLQHELDRAPGGDGLAGDPAPALARIAAQRGAAATEDERASSGAEDE